MTCVSVIIPCYQEASFIENTIYSIISLDRSGIDSLEVIVLDGGSTDGTVEILQALSEKISSLRILKNPNREVSYAINLGVKASSYNILVRCDAHTVYDKFYISNGVRVLLQKDADVVGGPWRAKGVLPLGKAFEDVFASPILMLGGRSHSLDYSGPADTVYLGFYKKDTFNKFGNFDTELTRNEDDEFNYRVKQGGGLVYQDSSIVSYYSPRESVFKLTKQYFQYGYWKLLVRLKRRSYAALRHYAPLCVLLLVGISLIIGIVSNSLLQIFLVGALSYLAYLLLGLAHMWVILHRRPRFYHPIVTIIMQFSYVTGVFISFIQKYILHSYPTKQNKEITR